MALAQLIGRIRNLVAPTYGEGATQAPNVDVNPRGEMCVAAGLPERSELVRLGNSWGAQIPTGSAFTFVNAWPTTRAELLLYNGEAPGGKSYIIDRVWMVNITSQAAAQPWSILGQIYQNTGSVAAAADNSAVLRQALYGNKKNYTGKAAWALANTAFMLTNQWFTLGGGTMSPMTTNLGASAEAFVYGRYIIPPGGAFGIAGLAGTAAGTAIAGIEHHEVQLPIAA
jgi:hypothetical protein